MTRFVPFLFSTANTQAADLRSDNKKNVLIASAPCCSSLFVQTSHKKKRRQNDFFVYTQTSFLSVQFAVFRKNQNCKKAWMWIQGTFRSFLFVYLTSFLSTATDEMRSFINISTDDETEKNALGDVYF